MESSDFSLPSNTPSYSTPNPRMIYQAAVSRIGMHVVQLFLLLYTAIHIEIVKPRLQKTPPAIHATAQTTIATARIGDKYSIVLIDSASMVLDL
jgi:hypothetical protein